MGYASANTSQVFNTWQAREAFELGFREAGVVEWNNAREAEFESAYAELLDSAPDAAAEAAIAWAYDRGAEAGHAQRAAQEIAEADPRVTFDATAHVFEAWSPAGEWCGAFDTYAEATRAAEGAADPWGDGVAGFELPDAR